MSNRFRRLKLTHTLRHGLSYNRLAPFSDDGETPLDATMKADRKSPTASNGVPAPSPALGGSDANTVWAVKSKDAGDCSRHFSDTSDQMKRFWLSFANANPRL